MDAAVVQVQFARVFQVRHEGPVALIVLLTRFNVPVIFSEWSATFRDRHPRGTALLILGLLLGIVCFDALRLSSARNSLASTEWSQGLLSGVISGALFLLIATVLWLVARGWSLPPGSLADPDPGSSGSGIALRDHSPSKPRRRGGRPSRSRVVGRRGHPVRRSPGLRRQQSLEAGAGTAAGIVTALSRRMHVAQYKSWFLG